MKKASLWAATLMMALGTAMFAFGAWQLLSSALSATTAALIVLLEMAISASLYGAFRRKWLAAFGPARPRTWR